MTGDEVDDAPTLKKAFISVVFTSRAILQRKKNHTVCFILET